jgi:hypothetical protein
MQLMYIFFLLLTIISVEILFGLQNKESAQRFFYEQVYSVFSVVRCFPLLPEPSVL